MTSDKSKRVVLVMCGSLAEARRIARGAVNARLAACVNIVRAPVESVYRWKGAVEKAREYLLLIKTTNRRLPALEEKVRKLHSYEVPEFIALPIAEGSRAYLRWLAECVRQPAIRKKIRRKKTRRRAGPGLGRPLSPRRLQYPPRAAPGRR